MQIAMLCILYFCQLISEIQISRVGQSTADVFANSVTFFDIIMVDPTLNWTV